MIASDLLASFGGKSVLSSAKAKDNLNLDDFSLLGFEVQLSGICQGGARTLVYFKTCKGMET